MRGSGPFCPRPGVVTIKSQSRVPRCHPCAQQWEHQCCTKAPTPGVECRQTCSTRATPTSLGSKPCPEERESSTQLTGKPTKIRTTKHLREHPHLRSQGWTAKGACLSPLLLLCSTQPSLVRLHFPSSFSSLGSKRRKSSSGRRCPPCQKWAPHTNLLLEATISVDLMKGCFLLHLFQKVPQNRNSPVMGSIVLPFQAPSPLPRYHLST